MEFYEDHEAFVNSVGHENERNQISPKLGVVGILNLRLQLIISVCPLSFLDHYLVMHVLQ